ncbi:MAG: hypothetical protein ACXVBE_07185 [Bdellovibrionota bacterium]
MRILTLTFLLSALFTTAPAHGKKGDVNIVNCSIFDESGKILRNYLGWVCAFYPNGRMLLGDGYTLTYYDEKMNVVWSKDEHVHNSIIYSEADDTALLLVSYVLPDYTRADRLEVYDKEGRLVKHFNFTAENKISKYPFNYDKRMLPTRVKDEITHVESFYRIGRNRSKNPNFKEGNYVVCDMFGAVYIFDSSLKKIIQTISLRTLGLQSTRDMQVTEAGNLLMYNSGNKDAQGRDYTTLDERDPVTGKVVWQYKTKNPSDFYGTYEGNLQVLPNHNILFSVVLNERPALDRKAYHEDYWEPWMEVQGNLQAIEITPSGKEVWRMVSKDSVLSGRPNVVKRRNLNSYLAKKKRY